MGKLDWEIARNSHARPHTLATQRSGLHTLTLSSLSKSRPGHEEGKVSVHHLHIAWCFRYGLQSLHQCIWVNRRKISSSRIEP